MTDKPETVAASAVQDDAKDAARFRWLRDHAINTEGAKGSPWCVYGLDLGDCTPAFGAELVAMVDDAMANGIVCSPVPVESLGRDADDPATESSDDQSWSGMDGATAWHLIDRHAGNWAHVGQMMNAWLAANRVSAPLPASVPDFYVCDAFISRLNEDGGCVDAILWKEPKANCIGVYVATPTTPEESP